MDPNELFEYAREGMKWLAIGGGSYLGALFGCQIYDAWPFHKKIQSKEELERVIKEECDKLRINHIEVEPVFKRDSLGYMRKNDNTNKWELRLKGDWQSTRNTVRHELYHYLKDVPTWSSRSPLNKSLIYLFIAEPRATLYGTFGIKL